MSLDSLSRGYIRPPRRNRGAYPNEVAVLGEEKAFDDSFMQSLQKELDIRITRADDTTKDVHQAATRRMEAELRLRAANAVKYALLRAKGGIITSFSAEEPLFDDLRCLDLDEPTPHLQGINEILTQRIQYEDFLDLQVEKASSGVLLAHEALKKCLEEEEVAMAREERCLEVIKNIEACISGMKSITEPPLNCAIWRLPESMWCQIFTEVVGDNVALSQAEATLPTGSISFPSLMLSAVCHSWRTIAQEYPLLWCTLHLTIDPFTLSDKRRIEHYKILSKGRALRIIIDVPGIASTNQLELIADSLSGSHTVESLIIRGGSIGREVINHISQRITPPKALTVAFSDDCSFQKFPKQHSMGDNLERLTLKNCSPAGMLKNPPPKSRKIVQLRVFNATSENIDWRLFYERFLPLSNTVQELVLVTRFCNTTLLNAGVGAMPLSHLTSIATDLTVLLLFYNSGLYTPVLKSLKITTVRVVNTDHWRAYANDQRGGANITKVNFDSFAEIIMVPWASVAAYLHFLPKLSTLSLQTRLAHHMLEAMATGTNKLPLGTLQVLRIIDYDGDGQQIVSFARNYQQDRRSRSDLQSAPNVAERGGMLKVELENCPNVSTQAMAELLEISSVSVESK